MSLLLILNGVFNFVVWPTFFKRVTRDPRDTDAAGRRTRFYTVHAIIVSVALLLAAASVIVGVLSISGVW